MLSSYCLKPSEAVDVYLENHWRLHSAISKSGAKNKH